MQKKRIRQLVVSGLMAVLLVILQTKGIGIYANEDNVSVLCILIVFGVLWLIPVVLNILRFKPHFSRSVSSMLFFLFQVTFWINLIMIVIPVHIGFARIYINIGILCLGVVLTIVIARYELKPKSGIPGKKELTHIKSAILELEIARSIVPELNCESVLCDMKQILEMETTIVHGIDVNMLNECRTIRNLALCKDGDAANLHIAMLEQLIVLSKQEI